MLTSAGPVALRHRLFAVFAVFAIIILLQTIVGYFRESFQAATFLQKREYSFFIVDEMAKTCDCNMNNANMNAAVTSRMSLSSTLVHKEDNLAAQTTFVAPSVDEFWRDRHQVSRPHRFIKQTEQQMTAFKERKNWSSERWELHLTSILSENVHRNGSYVIMTFVNSGLREATMNWIASLELHGYERFVILTGVDLPLYMFLAQYGYGDRASLVPYKWISNPRISSKFETFSTVAYNTFLIARVEALLQLTNIVPKILMTDADLVFLHRSVIEHVEYEDLNTDADLIFLIDSAHRETQEFVNAGFMFVKSTPKSKEMLKKTLELIQEGGSFAADQDAMQHVLFNVMKFDRYKELRFLDKMLYSSGRPLIVERIHERLKIYPYVAHFNWIVGWKPKKDAMKQLYMWYIADEFA